MAESRFALPATSIYGLLVWLAASINGIDQLWIGFVCFMATIYLMVELNNSNSLLSVYSRMVSSTFIVLSCTAVYTFTSTEGAIVQLCFAACYLVLYRSYQDRKGMPWIFYSFMILSLASIAFVQILYYVPAIWLIMAFNLRSMNIRTFSASILGLITPYWIYGGYCAIGNHLDDVYSHIVELGNFAPVDTNMFTHIGEHQIITFAFISLLAITAIIHYKRRSYMDKIRVRMIFDSFITIAILTLIFMILQPQHADILTKILIINLAPILAHYLTMTHTRITNISMIVMMVMAVLITAYNLWLPSLQSL